MKARFPAMVEYLYKKEGLRYPLDEGMDDIARRRFENIINEVCRRVDTEYEAEVKKDEQKAA